MGCTSSVSVPVDKKALAKPLSEKQSKKVPSDKKSSKDCDIILPNSFDAKYQLGEVLGKKYSSPLL
jgi:hypothetical protein